MKKRMEGNSHGGGRCGSWSKKEAAAEIRKGPWPAEEDEMLVNHVNRHGPLDWSSLRSKGLLQRTNKSCRLRWVNKLCSNLKNGCKFSAETYQKTKKFSAEKERIVIDLQAQFGDKLARIATYLPGRTDNDVKNFWSSRQKGWQGFFVLKLLRILLPEVTGRRENQFRRVMSFLPWREDPSGSANHHISVANNGNNARAHIFCPDVSTPQLGFHFGDENQGSFLINGGQFSTDVSLFQMPRSCSSGSTNEKIIRESYNFLEDLPTDMNDRFEQLPSPSRW